MRIITICSVHVTLTSKMQTIIFRCNIMTSETREMALLSMGVAGISFLIGYLVRVFMGVEI